MIEVKDLKQLKLKLEKFIEDKPNLKFAFNVFKKETNPPHIVVSVVSDNHKGADDKVYYKRQTILMELTTINKDLNLEEKIETELLSEIFYEKRGNYIPTERIYNVAYFFEIG